MDSGIIATLVVKTDSIAISALRIDVYGSDSREFTAKVVSELINVIVLASGITMAWSNQICLMKVIIPRIFTPMAPSLMMFYWRWMMVNWL